MLEYEPLVIESFKDEVVSQFIKDNFVEILNEQYKADDLKPERFIEKYFNYDDFNIKKLERWRKGETIKLKERYVKDFREMAELENMFLSNFYSKFYNEQVYNQEKHFQLKMGECLSKLNLLTIVSNAVETLYQQTSKNSKTTLESKIDILKKELDRAYLDYIDDI